MDLIGLVCIILGVLWILNGALFLGLLAIILGVVLGGAGVRRRF